MNKRVKFTFIGKPGSQVFLAGSFNNWSQTKKPMLGKKNTGEYSAICMLPAGHHEYKFVVDGIWVMDDNNQNFQKNEFGTLNNVLEIN